MDAHTMDASATAASGGPVLRGWLELKGRLEMKVDPHNLELMRLAYYLGASSSYLALAGMMETACRDRPQ